MLTMTTTARRDFALWIHPTGTFRLLAHTTPEHALHTGRLQQQRLSDNLVIWIDADAPAPRRNSLNHAAAAILRAFDLTPWAPVDSVLFTGDGRTGLTAEQALSLIELHLDQSATMHLPRQPRR